MFIKYLFLYIMISGCTKEPQNTLESKDVVSITILNTTHIANMPEKIILSKNKSIESIVGKINELESIEEVNTRASYGYYELFIDMKDKSSWHFMVMSTRYYGVVIIGSDKKKILMNQYYKNDKLDFLISEIVQNRNDWD